MVKIGKHGLSLVAIFAVMLVLTGCAVKPLKAPCSRGDGTDATASFAFQGERSNTPVSSVGFADGPSFSVKQVANSAACGPMRRLDPGAE